MLCARLHPPQGPRPRDTAHCFCCGQIVPLDAVSPAVSHADVCLDCDEFCGQAGVSPIDLRVLLRPRLEAY